MSEANETRGEISVDLEGVPYILRPSYEAQVAIERQTGRTIIQLADAAGTNGLSLEHAAIVVTECVKAQGRATSNATLSAFNARTVGECIVDTGALIVGKRLELLLYMAATGGYTAAGEAKAPAKPPTTEPIPAAA